MKKCILVIDDIPTVLDVVQAMLERESYEVITATDGGNALEQVKIKMPDLILLDLSMPIMNGYEFIEQFRQRYPQEGSIPIILLTAHKLAHDEIKRLEVAGYLQKPFRRKELLSRISELLSD